MEDDEYKMKHFTYYSKIVMMIVVGIQFILFIVFIVSVHNVGSIMNNIYNNKEPYNDYYIRNHYLDDFQFIFEEQNQAIDTCFAFFIISFTIFLIESIVAFSCGGKCSENNEVFIIIFEKMNHILIILTFTIIQFLYVISCLIIPIYLDRVRTFKKYFEDCAKDDRDELNAFNQSIDGDIDSIETCISKYVGLLVVSFTFLFIFLFLYFIIINLYKEVCCNMRNICDRTSRCMENFFRCFYDNSYYVFTLCRKARDKNINEIQEEINNIKEEIARKTCEIQDMMKNNIDLRIENIELL